MMKIEVFAKLSELSIKHSGNCFLNRLNGGFLMPRGEWDAKPTPKNQRLS